MTRFSRGTPISKAAAHTTRWVEGKKDFKFKVGKKQVSAGLACGKRAVAKTLGFHHSSQSRHHRMAGLVSPRNGLRSTGRRLERLVNQRLFGELVLEGFEVSHTKDKICSMMRAGSS